MRQLEVYEHLIKFTLFYLFIPYYFLKQQVATMATSEEYGSMAWLLAIKASCSQPHGSVDGIIDVGLFEPIMSK
jgi:hypothetical protein